MSKKVKKLDPNQLSFDFDKHIEEYTSLKEHILNIQPNSPQNQSYEEACIEVAVSIKRMIRRTNMSREQVVDAINDYFAWKKPSVTEKTGNEYGKQRYLSIHMFNHFLSKPAEYPIYAFYIFAIQRVTDSLELAQCFAEAEGARVISGDEVRQMTLGKVDETILEMQRLKKELRLRR